jgi:hypothetical protein
MHALKLLGISWKITLCLILPLLIVGCTTVQNPDGSTSRVLGFDSPEAQAQANESVKKAAGVLPFPFSSITEAVGTILVGAVGVYAAKKKGEDIGWDKRETHQNTVVDPAYAAGAAEQPKINTAANPVVTHAAPTA